MSIRTISYGGGVQSTALLVLAAQGRIDFKTFLFSNVGDDSEHPATLKYVREIAKPYAQANGISIHELARRRRDGSIETLWGRLMDKKSCPCEGEDADCAKCGGTGLYESRSLPIPVRMDNGAPGNRSCTADFKIKVIGKWLKEHGARGPKPCAAHKCVTDNCRTIESDRAECPNCDPGNVATVGIGISLDEIQRANARKVEPYERIVYPLVGIGEDTGLKMRRDDCIKVIREAGIPVPPKSSCFFCPFHRPTAWEDLARDEPDLFKKSCELEDTLNDRRAMLGKDKVWLTRFAAPLREVINDGQQLLPLVDDGDGSCDSGWCFT